MLYPMKFTPVYKENVWGGQKLRDVYSREIPYEHTGESWEVACHSHGMSIISNGNLKGWSLEKIFNMYKIQLLGECYNQYDKFPLLVKIIDAKQRLSLQVHPNDEYAKTHENGELGKCEMWYVIDAKPGAKITMGLKNNITKTDFCNHLANKTFEECIYELEVQSGDVINIPAGLIHAIEEDIMIAEVQQNSDTVYRVYDWNRIGLDGKPREVQIEKALEVIDFENKIPKGKIAGIKTEDSGNENIHYIANKYFTVEKIHLNNKLDKNTKLHSMHIYMCLEGAYTIKWGDNQIRVKAGETILIPASLEKYKLVGKAKILDAHLGDTSSQRTFV